MDFLGLDNNNNSDGDRDGDSNHEAEPGSAGGIGKIMQMSGLKSWPTRLSSLIPPRNSGVGRLATGKLVGRLDRCA